MIDEEAAILKPKESPYFKVIPVDKESFKKQVENRSENTLFFGSASSKLWHETDGTRSIFTGGAYPCLIIYAANKLSGRIISGHFPHVSEKEDAESRKIQLERLESEFQQKKPGDKVQIPSVNETQKIFGMWDNVSFEQYSQMKKRIEEWVKESGANNIEVYLFGQNDPRTAKTEEDKARNLMEATIDQNNVNFDFYKIGVSYFNQHDFRIPGRDKVDDTFYSAESKTIFHRIRAPIE